MINNIKGVIGLAARARKICFGADSVEDEIKKNKVKLVIIAQDSSERTKEKFKKICNQYNIPYIVDGTIEEISKTIGKSNKVIIGIRDINMAKGIQEKYSGGDVIE